MIVSFIWNCLHISYFKYLDSYKDSERHKDNQTIRVLGNVMLRGCLLIYFPTYFQTM